MTPIKTISMTARPTHDALLFLELASRWRDDRVADDTGRFSGITEAGFASGCVVSSASSATTTSSSTGARQMKTCPHFGHLTLVPLSNSRDDRALVPQAGHTIKVPDITHRGKG
jgi:hypothetical protein